MAEEFKEEAGKTEKIEEQGDNDAIDAIINRQKRQEGFLKSLEGGVSVLKASKAAGIDYSTIWRWRRDDKKFSDKVLTILDSRIMIVEDALFLNAAKGNLGAQIFWLKNRSQGRWKDKTEAEIDITHKGLDFDEFKNLKGMTKDERTAFIAELSEIIRSEDVGLDGKGQGNDKEESVVIKEDNIPKL